MALCLKKTMIRSFLQVVFRASFQVAWPLGPLDFRLAFDHFKQWIDLRDLDKETRVLDHQIPESIDGYIPLLVIITINSSRVHCYK